MTISILGIDIGKNSCSGVGVDDKGAVTVRRTMRRQTLIEFVSKIPTCILHHCYGGVLRCSSPGQAFRVPRARGPTDVAGICRTLSEVMVT